MLIRMPRYEPQLRLIEEYKNLDFVLGTATADEFEYRNIEALYHFTPVVNLPLIAKYGILSRDQLEGVQNALYFGLFSLFPDQNRHDNRKDYISCSINHPHVGLLKLKRRSLKAFGGIVILKIRKNIISESNGTLFFTGLASMKENRMRNVEELSNPSSILHGTAYSVDSEIMIRDHIPTRYIEKIYFSSRDQLSYQIMCFNRIYNFADYLNLFHASYEINDLLFGNSF